MRNYIYRKLTRTIFNTAVNITKLYNEMQHQNQVQGIKEVEFDAERFHAVFKLCVLLCQRSDVPLSVI